MQHPIREHHTTRLRHSTEQIVQASKRSSLAHTPRLALFLERHTTSITQQGLRKARHIHPRAAAAMCGQQTAR